MCNLFEKCCNASSISTAKRFAEQGGFELKLMNSDDSISNYQVTSEAGEEIELAFCSVCNGSLVDTTYCDRCDEIAENAFNQSDCY